MGHEDEDIDSMLANIMHGGSAQSMQPQPMSHRKPAPKPPIQHDPSKPLAPTMPVHSRPMRIHTAQPVQNHTRRAKRSWRLKPGFTYALLAITVVLAAGLLFYAVSTMPKSPFSKELTRDMEYPLLYPAKLPSGYLIDKSTVAHEGDVVIYAIKNKESSIHISLQPQPSAFNFKPLLDVLSDVRQIETPAGDTFVGKTAENRIISHTATGDVWVIVNFPKGAVSDADYEALVKSFKEG